MAVVIETTMGCLTVDLFVEERPITCTNFLKLCKMKYYNFCLFHSVQNNFIAQTGDPTGTGNGGESIFSMVHGENAKYYEAEAMPKIKHSKAGLVSMVNCGNNMLGSQFFFTLGDELHSLDGEHCVFGEVTEGHDVLIQLKEVICDEDHHPFRDIRITHTVVLEDPFDDPPNMTFPDSSPEPTKERLMNGRIAPDEEIDDTKGKTIEEVEEMVQKREAHARATILEIVGDIPDADIAPPENILFVCKLNPVTTDESLEIIFGRFGTIKSCEVIRDKATGDSLQYAFIEFEDKKACENAYFKMDNVLIDDRRIHVDFSQSVARMRWRGKGKGVDYFPDNKQKELQKRELKEIELEKYDSKERKSHRSRSRSPARPKWRAHDERTSERESWDRYQDRNRVKSREEFSRRYERNWESGDGKNRDKSERYYFDKSKRHDFYGQRSYERGRDTKEWSAEVNYNWEKRRSREGREHLSQGRSGGAERTMESPEMIKERERKKHSRSRLMKAKDGDFEEKKRNSKERYSMSEKYTEDREKHGGRNEKASKEEKESRSFHGESSRNDERKYGDRGTSRQRREEKFHRSDADFYRNEHDMSSETEERGGSEKRRRSEEWERNSRVDSGRRRNDEVRPSHYDRNSKSYEEGECSRERDDSGKEKSHECKSTVGDADSGGSVKHEGSQLGRHGRREGAAKKDSDRKISKKTAADGSKHLWSSGKTKKSQGIKEKKMQKRKRYSSSSSCCSDSSCSCDSSCFSSSSDSENSDDSDCESNSDASESVSSSSTSPVRRSKLKRKRNKKKLASEGKRAKIAKTGHRKKLSSSSESSASSAEDVKSKLKHRKRKVVNSSSSEHKSQSLSRSRKQKVKKRPKKRLRRKEESSESSSEESSSSVDSVAQRKMRNVKRSKKMKKDIMRKKMKSKRNKLAHKGRKTDSSVSLKKKRKKNDSLSSESASSSGESDSGSSKEERKMRKDMPIKGKGVELARGR